MSGAVALSLAAGARAFSAVSLEIQAGSRKSLSDHCAQQLLYRIDALEPLAQPHLLELVLEDRREVFENCQHIFIDHEIVSPSFLAMLFKAVAKMARAGVASASNLFTGSTRHVALPLSCVLMDPGPGSELPS